MSTSKGASAIVRRSLSWASSFMAIAAATLLSKADHVQAASEIKLDTISKQVADQSMGYILIGDFDDGSGGRPPHGD